MNYTGFINAPESLIVTLNMSRMLWSLLIKINIVLKSLSNSNSNVNIVEVNISLNLISV